MKTLSLCNTENTYTNFNKMVHGVVCWTDLRCVKHQLSAIGVGGLDGLRPAESISFAGDRAISLLERNFEKLVCTHGNI